MSKTNESKRFMLGNWLLYNGEVVPVGVYELSQLVIDNDIYGDKYESIPLTPEILLKAGFEKKEYEGMEWRDSYVIETSNNTYYGFILGKDSYDITNPNKGIMIIHHPFKKNIPYPNNDDLNNKIDLPERNYHLAWYIA